MKEKIYYFKSDKYIFREKSIRKKLIKVWNLIHDQSNLDLSVKPLDDYNKYCLPFKGISKFKDGTIEYEGEMLGYLEDNNKIKRYFDCPHGKGINYSTHGFKFIFNGYWKYGFAHGKGVFLNDACEFYVGVWKDGYLDKLIHEFKWLPELDDKKYHLGKLTKVKKPKNDESMNNFRYDIMIDKSYPKKSRLYMNFGRNMNFEVLDLNANYCYSRGGVTDGIPDPVQSVEELMELHSDSDIEFFREHYDLGKKNHIINLNTPKIKKLTTKDYYPKKKKNFDETYIISETGHRRFHISHDYSKKEDYKVYKKGKQLKLYNKKLNTDLEKDTFNSYFTVEKHGALLAVKNKTVPFGTTITLLGDSSYLKSGEKVRIVRKIKKK